MNRCKSRVGSFCILSTQISQLTFCSICLSISLSPLSLSVAYTRIHMNTCTHTHSFLFHSSIHLGSRQMTHYPQTLQCIFIKPKISTNRAIVYPSKSGIWHWCLANVLLRDFIKILPICTITFFQVANPNKSHILPFVIISFWFISTCETFLSLSLPFKVFALLKSKPVTLRISLNLSLSDCSSKLD